MNSAFTVIHPRTFSLPIVISAPHVGVEFPDDLKTSFHSKYISWPEDTDWFVDELYDFASDLGVTIIRPRYSRYVIDLNRAPDSAALYSDGRVETGLLPLTTFQGDALYSNGPALEKAKSLEERNRRLELYYQPYHREVKRLLEAARAKSPHALLFEAHSIRPDLPQLISGKLPDLILGDDEGKTAAPELSCAAFEAISASPFNVSLNKPFRGGFLTRKFGRPETGIHALQLEMSQAVYMNTTYGEVDGAQAKPRIPVLRECVSRLAHTLPGLA